MAHVVTIMTAPQTAARVPRESRVQKGKSEMWAHVDSLVPMVPERDHVVCEVLMVSLDPWAHQAKQGPLDQKVWMQMSRWVLMASLDPRVHVAISGTP